MSIQIAASPVDILRWQRRVVSDTRLSHSTRLIATSLSLFINARSGQAWPSLATLANASNTWLSSVKRAINALVEYKFIQIQRGNAHRSNRYRAILHLDSTPSVTETPPAATPEPAAPAFTLTETPSVSPEAAAPPSEQSEQAEQAQPAEAHSPAAPVKTPDTAEPADTPAPTRARVDDATIARVIDHLNQRTNSCFPDKPGSKAYRLTRRALHQYPPEILCAVIDLKRKQWHSTPQARYLRPQTLFNLTKLESYCNEVYQREHQRERMPPAPPQPKTIIRSPESVRIAREHIGKMRNMLQPWKAHAEKSASAGNDETQPEPQTSPPLEQS